MPAVEIIDADLDVKQHQQAVVEPIDAYARNPMENCAPLPEETRRALMPGLRKLTTTIILPAFRGASPIGIAPCCRGFSTFAARPLINIQTCGAITIGSRAEILQ